ncbi:hypothetical protein NDR87_36765 [Nocardia sp. CDC159]|uniref:Uncharacterized protein n=1 Tax=Nocardia pulmonis TaxID=2951408 RepID=A0A9X2EGB9_9NOCA|nr:MULTISPECIES: hypothetical protein [Nocardia]MCM6779040.1 hypothetical protein [Nocardia pulmonis]MCM6791930.1 hypothetical protein [Nocardia sp. CDC159]
MTNPQDYAEYSDEVPIKPDRDRTSEDRRDQADAQNRQPEPATDTAEGSGEPPD